MIASLFAPASDGFNLFAKWQLDGVDLTTSQLASVTMNANHTATAVYASPNDLCAQAIALTNGISYAMNTSGATTAGDPFVPCGPLQKGVWFTYTPAAHEQVTISTCVSSFDTMLQVFTGTCAALQRVGYGCDDDSGPACVSSRASVVFNGQAGVTYYILAGGYFGGSGNLQIIATSALVNDDCSGAIPLHFGAPFTMTTINATTTASESPICRPNFGRGVWFTFTSPVTGPVPISTCGSSFDTVLSVHTGACGALTSVACDDDSGPSCPGLQASVTLNATAGTQYYILAGGYSSLSGELFIMAGSPPTLSISRSASTVTLNWPTYFFPYYVLQQQLAGPGGIGSGTWQDLLPNVYPGVIFPLNTLPTFYRLVTP